MRLYDPELTETMDSTTNETFRIEENYWLCNITIEAETESKHLHSQSWTLQRYDYDRYFS